MTAPLTGKWIEEQLELCRQATPGPWEYDGMHNEIVTPAADSGQYWLIVSECRSAPDQTAEQDQFGHMFDANFALIAAMRQGYPLVLRILQMIARRWPDRYEETTDANPKT